MIGWQHCRCVGALAGHDSSSFGLTPHLDTVLGCLIMDNSWSLQPEPELVAPVSDQYYPIIEINSHSATEARGSRRKFWVRREDEDSDWLLKFPRLGTGEHWAEKVAAEVGELVRINVAHVELARSDGELATICKSFSSGDGSLLGSHRIVMTWHSGSEFLASATPSYDVDQTWFNRAHNIKHIVAAVQPISGDALSRIRNSHTVLQGLADHVLLDGLIGNTDRHHDNWMIGIADGDRSMHLSPAFDHASSLGRELIDERRRSILEGNSILRYLKRANGGVFVSNARRHAPSPLALSQLLCRWQPNFFEEKCKHLASVPDTAFRSILDQIPPEYMSEIAKEFAYQVIITSKVELMRSIK